MTLPGTYSWEGCHAKGGFGEGGARSGNATPFAAAAALSSPLEILAEPRNAEDMVDQAGRRKREGRRFQTPEDLDDIVFGGDGGLTLSCFSRHEDR